MSDPEIDVVDYARQRVEVRAVGADHYRVGERSNVDGLVAAHQIDPGHQRRLRLQRIGWLRIRQPKTPVGAPPFGFELAALLIGKLQSSAIVDGWQSPGKLTLAAALQLLSRFITRIEPARSLQLLGNRVIAGRARRLALLAVPGQPQPLEILADSLRKLLGRALDVGVVEAEDESAAMPPRKEPVQHGGAHVADMKAAGRAPGETDGYGHSDSGARCSRDRHPTPRVPVGKRGHMGRESLISGTGHTGRAGPRPGSE